MNDAIRESRIASRMAAIAFSLCPQSPTVNAQRTFETRSRPAFARRYPRDFTFYLENPFPRLFVHHYIAEWSEWDERHRRKSDEGRSENGAGGDASNIDGQTERSNGALGKATYKAKPRWVAASELGSERVSNVREHMSQSAGSERVSK